MNPANTLCTSRIKVARASRKKIALALQLVFLLSHLVADSKKIAYTDKRLNLWYGRSREENARQSVS